MMMQSLTIFRDNAGFLSQAYGSGFSPLFIVLGVLALFDLILKGFALWRAARMEKMGWFIALLIVNSMGILPLLYLLMTRESYAKLKKPSRTAASVLMENGTKDAA